MCSQRDVTATPTYLLYAALPPAGDIDFLENLSSHRIDVQTYHSRTDLAAALESKCPDLLLLHFSFVPATDYAEVMEEFRRVCSFKGLPVVAVGPENDSDCLLAAFQAGASDYISLPAEAEKLAGRLERQLAAVRAARTLDLSLPTGGTAPAPDEVKSPATSVWDAEIERARRYGTPLTLILFEWEPLDTEAVKNRSRMLAEILQRKSRKSDKITDISETQLGVLLPGSTLHGGRAAAVHMAQTLKREMAALETSGAEVKWNGVRVFEMPRDYRGTGEDLLKLLKLQPPEEPGSSKAVPKASL